MTAPTAPVRQVVRWDWNRSYAGLDCEHVVYVGRSGDFDMFEGPKEAECHRCRRGQQPNPEMFDEWESSHALTGCALDSPCDLHAPYRPVFR